MSIQYSPRIVTNGLVLALDAGNNKSYPRSGTLWYDKSGYNNNGILTNGPLFNTGSGGNIVFDGVDDYVDCGPGTTLNSITSYTVSCWIKMTDALRAFNPFFARRDPNSNTSDIEMYTGNGGITLVHNRANGGTFGYNVFTSISNNTLTHVTISYGSNTWTTYFNGTLSQQVTTTILGASIPVPIATTGLSTEIGRFYYGAGDESIYDYSVYNRALTANEVAQNFNALRKRFGL